MKILKLLLYPFAALYNLVMRFRNYLYDIGHKPSFQFNTAVVAVGNLTVGGSGKTPMIEYLIQLLKAKYGVATLSRGYKRDTKGYRKAQRTDTARSLGDEPFQLFRKFGDEINVFVGEDRAFAIPHILQESPQTDVILLDDALQHRSVKPQVTILVTEYSNPFYRDFVLPFGRLREARVGASRSDLVVVTKCNPATMPAQKDEMTSQINRYAGPKPIFFSCVEYDSPRSIGAHQTLSKNVILVSGIAKTQPLTEYCFSNYNVLKHFKFPDHHRYSRKDLAMIESFCKSQTFPFSIITTEKDMVKLIAPEFKQFLDQWSWFYMPIRQVFLQDGLKFDALIFAAVTPAVKN